MSLWRHVSRGLSVLTRRAKADRDIADEVEHYFDEAVADLESSGLTAEEARRRARKELGSPARVREEVRAFGWENAVAATLSDVRYAARRLKQSPGFTAVGALTLALGIGASAAIFSVVFPILFEPLPYPQPGRVAMVWESEGRYPSFGTFRGLAQRSGSFEALAAISGWQPALIGFGEPQRLQGQRVSAEYFRCLGVPPALGRDFALSDDVPQAPRVVILSDALWRGRFGADRAILGRPVTLNDDAYTVIGVMPPNLENVLDPGARLWTPLRYDPSLPADGKEWGHHLRMVGRLRAGVGPDRASSELSAILPELARLYPRGYEYSGGAPRAMVVTPLQSDLARAVRPALLAILGAVSLLLVIACVNVTNLLLARGAQRRGEIAVRLALGAGRGRLLRQLLAESVLLSALGAVPGVAMAVLGVRALVTLAPRDMPRAEAIGLDPAIVIFALAVTAAVGLAVGIIPALQAFGSVPAADLAASSRRSSGGHQRTRRALVVSELALALVLLVSAGLLLRSLQRLFAVAPGFNPSGVLTMEVQASGHRFDQAAAGNHFFSEALEAARAVPGVAAAGFTSQLPLSGDFDSYGTLFEKDAGARGDAVFRYMVSPGYCETLGIPLRRGRLLEPRDDLAASPGAVLISESLARKEFGSRDPLGQRLRIGPEDAPWLTIVGVVGDVKQLSLAIDDAAAVYVTPAHWPWPDRARSLVVRAEGDATALASPIRKAIWSVDKDQPIVRIATMETLLAASAAERRFAFVLFEVFALAALGLAAIGSYGVLAGGVVERTREIGVRAALGASRRSILALVTRQGLALAGLGVGIGLIGAMLASRALVTLLFGVTRLDPATYLGMIAVLLAVAALACVLPAWRAARIDPAITLRAE